MRISDWSSDVCSSDLVDEFSSFARMPAPVMRREDIGRLVEQAVFLQRTAQPQVQFGYTPPPQPLVVPCDGRQVSQALTNLIKNAIESIAGGQQAQGEDAPGGAIRAEKRRGGKECGRTGRSRGSPNH